MQGYLAAIGLALMVILCAVSYTQGKAAGKTECIAERSIAADRVQAAIDLRDQRSADTRIDMLDLLRVTIPPLEIATHETTERIRTVYKDRPIPSVCAAAVARPERVQEDIDATRDRVNRALGAVRLGSAVASPAGPGMAGDRSVGRDHDGPVRDRGHSPERGEYLPGQAAHGWGYQVSMGPEGSEHQGQPIPDPDWPNDQAP